MGANLKDTCIVIDDDSIYLVDNEKSEYLVKDDGFREIPSDNFKYLPASMKDYDGKVMAISLPPGLIQAIRDETDPHEAPGVLYIRKGSIGFEELKQPPRPKHPSGLDPNNYKGDSFEDKIIHYMLTNDNPVAALPEMGYKKEYDIFHGQDECNIIYIKNADHKFGKVIDSHDGWDDRRLIIKFDSNKRPKIVFNQKSTIDAGKFYTKVRRLNREGALAIYLGQQQCHCFGKHKGRPALVQCRKMAIFRDSDSNNERGGDPVRFGSGFGANQHDGGGASSIGRYSAGCQVGCEYDLHLKFLNILKTDPRYKQNRSRVWNSSYLDRRWIIEGKTSPVSEWD